MVVRKQGTTKSFRDKSGYYARAEVDEGRKEEDQRVTVPLVETCKNERVNYSTVAVLSDTYTQS